MAEYTVQLSKKAAKQLDKLPDQIAFPLLDAIQQLADNPRPFGSKKLKGKDSYRIRRGNYRVIYDIFDAVLIIDVIAAGHRKDIYKKK